MSENQRIGIDRRIRLEWLERTVLLLLAGLPEQDISRALLDEVGSHLSVQRSRVKRGSGEKAVTNLMKTWIRIPPHLQSLRDAGVALFEATPEHFHIALHWGMILAVYPFWASVASHTGRLLKLQGNVSPSQIQRRLKEQYGERSTVEDATRRVLRAMHDWGVLKDTPEKGVYQASHPLVISELALAAWLFEALLYTQQSQQATLPSLIHAPSLFPFNLCGITASEISSASPRIDIFRQSLDDEIVVLKTPMKKKQ